MIDALADLEEVTRMLKLPGGRPVAESRKLLERAATDLYEILTVPYEPGTEYASMLSHAATAVSLLSVQMQMVAVDVLDEAFDAQVGKA